MNYCIKIVSVKKATISVFILISLYFISIIIMVISGATKNEIFLMIYSNPVFLAIIIVLGYKFSSHLSDIKLTDLDIEFDEKKIKFTDIVGYYINEESLSQITFEFKTSDKCYSITSLRIGKNGKEFKRFLQDFKTKSRSANKEIKTLSYYSFHNKQYLFIKYLILVMFVLIVLLDILYLYLVIFKSVDFNFRLLFPNVALVGLWHFHKKNELKNKLN